MSTTFVPEVIEATTEIVKEVTVAAHLNLPPAGTLMRATRGNTVIEFRVPAKQIHDPKHLFSGVIAPGEWDDEFAAISHDAFAFWHDDDWAFEILETPEDVS